MRLTTKQLFWVLFAVLILATAVLAQPVPLPTSPTSGWQTLKLGGGGLVSGIDVTLDPGGTTETKLIRTDVGGGYIFNETTQRWDQLITTTRMPSTDVLPTPLTYLQGVYEIAAAPSNTDTIYIAYHTQGGGGRVFKSADHGARFARTAFPPIPNMDANDSRSKTYGPKMAVDPQNENVVYIGTLAGAFFTVDGGLTWNSIRGVTQPTAGIPIIGFAFDKTSGKTASTGTTGGRTNTVWLISHGSGTWKSTDAGLTFSRVLGGPTDARRGKIDADGVYYAVSEDLTKVWRCIDTTWTDISPLTNNQDDIVVNPFDRTQLIVVLINGAHYYATSANRGVPVWTGSQTNPKRSGSDIPWHDFAREDFMGVGAQVMSPISKGKGGNQGKVWFAEGIGVFYTNQASSAEPVIYTGLSAGIEELVTNNIRSSPSGDLVISFWDRAVFKISDPAAYPSSYGPNLIQQIEMGWGLDWASSNTSSFALLNLWRTGQNTGQYSSYSLDGGSTWNLYNPQPGIDPDMYIGGMIAASTPDNIVMAPANEGDVYYSKNATHNRAAVWTRIDASIWGNGMQNAGKGVTTGWGHATYGNMQTVCADRVNFHTFYISNYQSSQLGGGLYRSIDGGDTWYRKLDQLAVVSGINDQLRCVPNLPNSVSTSGHMFYTAGHGGNALYRLVDTSPSTKDGRIIKTRVNASGPQTIGEVYAIGFGAVKVGNNYPSVYVYGVIGGVLGMYRSDSDADSWSRGRATWSTLGPFPAANSTDFVKSVEGDAVVWGKVYVGFNNGVALFSP
jgi:hypothetical protein